MGWSSSLYVLQADKYHKLLRPLLRNNFGTLPIQFFLDAERKLIESSDLMHGLGRNHETFQDKNYDQKGRTPLRRYFQTHPTAEFYGNGEDDQLQDVLSQIGTPVYDDGWPYGHGTQLMRFDNGLQYIDAFQSGLDRIRICNMEHVQNYIRYLEIIEEAYKDVRTWAFVYYSLARTTKTIFNDILTLMKKEGKDPLLFSRID